MPEGIDPLEQRLAEELAAYKRGALVRKIIGGSLLLAFFAWRLTDAAYRGALARLAPILPVSIALDTVIVVVTLWLLPGRDPNPFETDGTRAVWAQALGLVTVVQVLMVVSPLFGILWLGGLMALFRQGFLKTLLWSVSIALFDRVVYELLRVAGWAPT